MPPKELHEVELCLSDGTKLTRLADMDTITELVEKYEFVRVVRCKDCRHNGTWSCMANYGADEIMPMDNDDFCSWGERK